MKFKTRLKLPALNENGFTLIEILVVLALLGALAGIVIANVSGFMGSGKEDAMRAERDNIQTAVLALMVANTTPELIAEYDEIQGEDDMYLVKAKIDGNPSEDSLHDFIIGGEYPLMQAYDIATNGFVSVD